MASSVVVFVMLQYCVIDVRYFNENNVLVLSSVQNANKLMNAGDFAVVSAIVLAVAEFLLFLS